MQVPAQALEPNGTNPLGLDPMFLAAAYYGSMAWANEMAEEGWQDPNSEAMLGTSVGVGVHNITRVVLGYWGPMTEGGSC